MMNKDNIFIKQPEGGLLQSKDWAIFLRAENSNIIEINYYNPKNNKVKKKVDIFGIENKLAIVGKYLYIPRLTFQNKLNKNDILQEIMQKCELEKFGWLRIDLLNNDDLQFLKQNLKYSIKKAPHDMQPKDHLIIDISLSEEDLLKQMKSKTRYNIRLAKRKGVKIFSSSEQKYLKNFYDLVNKTAERKQVNFHSFEHYQKMFESLPENKIKLYLAEYEGKIIAANIITFHNRTATYLHGGLDGEYRKLMAPFLLQWKAIQDAKKTDCVWYDLGGVFLNSQDSGKVGITRFKKGFSPKTEIFQTVGSHDIIFCSVKYQSYKILQKVKSLIK